MRTQRQEQELAARVRELDAKPYPDMFNDDRVKSMIELTNADNAVELGAALATSKGEGSITVSVSISADDTIRMIDHLYTIAKQNGWL